MTCVHCGVGPDAKNAGFDGLRSTNEGIRAAIASLPKSPVTVHVELFDLDDPDPKKRAVARAVWRTQ